MYEMEVCQGAFLLQKFPLFQSEFRIEKFTRRRLNDTGVSSSAELDQQALPAGHLQAFKKA